MIRNTGVSHRAKIDGVETAQPVEPVFGHHPAGPEIGFAAPVKMLPGKSRVVTSPCRFQYAKTFGHDLATDAVPFNDCNLVLVHYNSWGVPGSRNHLPR